MQVGTTLGLGPQTESKQTDPSKKIAEAATQFESILLNQMLQSAKASSADADSQDSAVTDYGQQQFAQALAKQGGLGIAKLVVASLAKHAD